MSFTQSVTTNGQQETLQQGQVVSMSEIWCILLINFAGIIVNIKMIEMVLYFRKLQWCLAFHFPHLLARVFSIPMETT